MNTRKTLAAVAVLACLPYIALKVLWLSGSSLGIDESVMGDSVALDVANLITLFMEVVALTMAVVLASSRRSRVPAPLVQVPMYVGTGLLGTILIALPAQALLGFDPGGAEATDSPIADWVFLVVYSGFSVLGVSLLTLFALHAWERWVVPGGWRSPVGSRSPATPGIRRAALTQGVLLVALAVATVAHAAAGPGIGGHDVAIMVLAVAVLAGLAALARGRPARLSGAAALIATYVGSAGLATWGSFFVVISAVPNPLDDSGPDLWQTDVLLSMARATVALLVPLTVHLLRPARLTGGPVAADAPAARTLLRG